MNINHTINANLLRFDYLYTVENYITFSVTVKSGSFSGTSNFCISKETLKNVIDEMTQMHNLLRGLCKINDNDSDAHIMFEINNLGHLLIHGQIGGSHQDHYMQFKFFSDQTFLLELINSFNAAVKKT